MVIILSDKITVCAKFQLKKGAGITKIHQLTQNTFVRNNNKTNKFFLVFMVSKSCGSLT